MRLSGINQQLKGYLDLIRPFTLLAPIIVSSSIMIASFFYNGGSSDLFTIWWTIIIPASFALAVLNGASNTLNQVTDIKTDKQITKKRTKMGNWYKLKNDKWVALKEKNIWH